jgi:hypothetical protein
MAGSSLFTLIDDIATLLDDVSVMSKVALKKTAGVVGDDLALNAEQVTGVHRARELPVVWAVAKGSFWNKTILVPSALVISWLIPWAVLPLLMVGGLFLCYEGAHKIWHSLHKHHHREAGEHGEATHPQEAASMAAAAAASRDPQATLAEFEREKIAGAIRTDFILSAEIIVITLGALTDVSFAVRVGSLVAVAVLITVGVYGLVAAIVKLDDAGVYLFSREGDNAWPRFQRSLGAALLWIAPRFLRLLSIAGTIAMFLVGGGIIAHTFHAIEEAIHHAAEAMSELAALLGWLTAPLLEGLLGLAAGVLVALAVAGFARAWQSLRPRPVGD